MIACRSGLFAGTLALLVIGVGSPALQAQSNDRPVAITDAVIFDATGRAPYSGTVIIRNGRIAEVGPNARVPSNATIIRAKGKALLPGIFDVHTHWSPTGTPGNIPQIANRYVANGVTTVNDFHQQPESFAPRRAWLARLVTPHVNFVARMSTPGGHGADWGDTNTTKWVASADSARREVDALQPYGPDFIKVFADGWRYGTQPEETSMNFETLHALVDEAHKYHERVLTHTVTVERGKIAARAGVDVIAHSLQDRVIDAEGISLIKAAGTFYAPTLAIYEPPKAGQPAPANSDDSAVRQRLRKWEFAKTNLKALFDAGVPIVLGTDSGIGDAPHGDSTLREIELLVDAGLSPTAALLAGTSNSALALGLLSDRGTIESGKRADIVLIDGTPWKNISDVRKVDRVFIDGKLVFGPGSTPPAENQMTAMAPVPATPLIDDFERSDGRSSLDTLRLSDMDEGVERSVVVMNLVPRIQGGHALAVAARMSLKDKPEAGVIIPLRRGSVQPVDARKFQGIKLELRGKGRYQIVVNTLSGAWKTEIDVADDWSEFVVPFSSLTKDVRRSEGRAAWRGNDLLQVGVIVRRDAASSTFSEIDNVRFY